ncbi:MAG: deoxyribose-phosphate aldolase [Planctomycetaceae bacterium]|jgi:deoxyribose-phosphate aldolase|nr:deoxyribose-phosphate aldolase [Planctomycetaceae bacterium]
MSLEKLDVKTVASMLDVSAVQASSTKKDVLEYAEIAIKYDCKAVFVLPSFLPLLREIRGERNGKFLIGAPVGFPAGGMTTEAKVLEAKSYLKFDVDEFDLMINVGFLLSGMYKEVRDDIKAVKDAVGEKTVKVIIECHYLDMELMKYAAEAVVSGGAEWVKTGTGWTPTGATFENIAYLKKIVDNTAKVKAAGGVRDLETIQKMIKLGAERFGVGGRAKRILEEAEKL